MRCFQDGNFTRILFVYQNVYQSTEKLHSDFRSACSFIEFYENELPDDMDYGQGENVLIVADDVYDLIADSSMMLELFTKRSNNSKISIIFTSQDFYSRIKCDI